MSRRKGPCSSAGNPSELHNGVMVDRAPFARLRLTGGRFDDQGMPVETLVELAQYRELVLGVARVQFLREHPERQRVPRGFFDRLQLRLRTVEDGSAVPVLERVASPGTLLDVDDDFTRARDAIEDAVAAAETDQPPPDGFPPKALVLFNRFGQTLRPDEAIELRRGSAATGPRYTVDTRRKLLLSKRRTYQEELQGIGWISEVDGNGMSCRIRLRMGLCDAGPRPPRRGDFRSCQGRSGTEWRGAAGTGFWCRRIRLGAAADPVRLNPRRHCPR